MTRRPNLTLLATSALALALIGCGASGGSKSSSDDTTDTGATTGDTSADTTDTTDTGDATTDDTTDTGTGDATTDDTGTDTGTDTGIVDPPETDDDNHSFETALELPLAAVADGELTDESVVTGKLAEAGEVDYYTFEGAAGQALGIFSFAQDTAFDPNTVDLVMTVYGADMKQVAFNDDPTPRVDNDSSLLLILPADGTYYVTMQECWTIIESLGGACADPQIKPNNTYGLIMIDVSDTEVASGAYTRDDETGDTPAEANLLTYNKSADGPYELSHAYGLFEDETDVDVFSFTIPEDTTVNSGRSTGDFWLYPSGSGQSGATMSVGKLSISAAAEPDVILVQIDGTVPHPDDFSTREITAPLELGVEYLLWVAHPGGAAGANDFYYVSHAAGGSNPVEAAEADNNELATAELLPPQADPDGSLHYFIDGNIIEDAADVDHYKVELPETLAAEMKLYLACGAALSGSGLRGVTASIHDAEGTMLPGATVTESDKKDLFIEAIDIPEGATEIVFKVTAESQAEDVASDFYRCGMHILTPDTP